MKLDVKRWSVLIIIAICLLSEIIILSYFAFGRPGLEAISIITTGLLTLALVVLYWQQHLSLRSQQEPLLDINDIEIYGDLKTFHVMLSNFGGGAATSMDLVIEFYKPSGEGPIGSAEGRLRRYEERKEGLKSKTRSSSILPSETNIQFGTKSKTVIGPDSSNEGQQSIKNIVSNLQKNGENLIYGRLTIEYGTKFNDCESHVADFSLKFTTKDGTAGVEDYVPWAESNQRRELGGQMDRTKLQ
ncbi:hypothetical protein [Halomontanus rarus]|uniref:hypothetical protein n=1 Tax=Halomontanus rarus TaxID=3034020 RepID=UPI00293BF86E|nr:hypothetical protein [Halovivax sp. KZCA124]